MACIEVTLETENTESVVDELCKLPSIRKAIDQSKHKQTHDDKISIDVEKIAITRDIYGNKNHITSEEAIFLSKYAETDAFSEEDLDLDEEGWLGDVNKNFIRWIKHISQSRSLEASIYYMHERGDYLYETARWVFNYKTNPVICEEFCLTNYDGFENPEWSKKVIRRKNMTVEFINE